MIEFMRSALTAHTNSNGTEASKRPTQALARDHRDDARSLAVTQSQQQKQEVAVALNELGQEAAVQRLESTLLAHFEANRLKAKAAMSEFPDESQRKESGYEALVPKVSATPNKLQDLHSLAPDAVVGTRLDTTA